MIISGLISIYNLKKGNTYDKKYNVIMSLRSYKSDTNKYKMGDYVTIKDLENISFSNVLEDLNGRLN